MDSHTGHPVILLSLTQIPGNQRLSSILTLLMPWWLLVDWSDHVELWSDSEPQPSWALAMTNVSWSRYHCQTSLKFITSFPANKPLPRLHVRLQLSKRKSLEVWSNISWAAKIYPGQENNLPRERKNFLVRKKLSREREKSFSTFFKS